MVSSRPARPSGSSFKLTRIWRAPLSRILSRRQRLALFVGRAQRRAAEADWIGHPKQVAEKRGGLAVPAGPRPWWRPDSSRALRAASSARCECWRASSALSSARRASPSARCFSRRACSASATACQRRSVCTRALNAMMTAPATRANTATAWSVPGAVWPAPAQQPLADPLPPRLDRLALQPAARSSASA